MIAASCAQGIGQVAGELYPWRVAREGFVIRGLPKPRPIAGKEGNGRGNGPAVQFQPIDPRLSFARKRSDRASEKTRGRRVRRRRRAGSALPTCGFDRKIAGERRIHRVRVARNLVRQCALFRQPAVLTAKLLQLLRRRLRGRLRFRFRRSSLLRHQGGARMRIELRGRAVVLLQVFRDKARDRSVGRE